MARSMARRSAQAVVLALALALVLPQASLTPVRAAEPSSGGPAVTLTVVADTEPPSAPIDFRVFSRTKGGHVTLTWTAATDNVGVDRYSLYRDGCWMGTLTQAGVNIIGPFFHDRLGGKIKTIVRYDLYAADAAGNVSLPATISVAP